MFDESNVNGVLLIVFVLLMIETEKQYDRDGFTLRYVFWMIVSCGVATVLMNNLS